jgi:hypothetical protein
MEKKDVIVYMDNQIELANKATLIPAQLSHLMAAMTAGLRYIVEKSD